MGHWPSEHIFVSETIAYKNLYFSFLLSNKSSDNSEKRDSPPTSPTFQSNILKRLSDEESGYNTLPDKIAKISKDVKTEVGNWGILAVFIFTKCTCGSVTYK